jgi:hypothetical protein
VLPVKDVEDSQSSNVTHRFQKHSNNVETARHHGEHGSSRKRLARSVRPEPEPLERLDA